MQTFGKTYTALLWKLLERGGSKALRLIVQIILARILAPEEFGLLAVMLVFISLGDIVVLGGLNSALIQSVSPQRVDYSTAFWISMGFSLASFLVLLVLSNPIAVFYDNLALAVPLQVLALQFFPLSFNSIQVAKTTRQLNMRPVFIGAIASEVVASIVAIWMAMEGLGLWSLIAQQLIAALTACCVTALFVKWLPRLEFSSESAKTLISFGWKVMGTELLNSAANSMYTLLVGKWYSTKDLGYYSQGQRYPSAICEVITGALAPVLLADFSSRSQCSKVHLKHGLRKANRETMLVMTPIIIIILIYAEPIIRLLLTEKWLPCTTILQLFCLISLLKSTSLICRQALLAIGKSELPMRIALLKLPFSLVLLGLVYASGGNIEFATAAWMIAGLFEQLATSVYCREYLGYKYPEQISDMGAPLALGCICAILPLIAAYFNVPYLVSGILYLILYCIIVLLIRIKSKSRK